MSSLRRELVCLILQFLDEENFKETAHKLEKESGVFFNMKYFEDCVTNGEWDEVDKYLSGFTKVEDNRYSMKIFFEIRKHKYLEALDKRENGKAVDILLKDLKVFSSFNEDVFKEIALLLTLGNFRENEQLSKYGDTKSARAFMLVELKKLIEANPLFRDKLQFPLLKNSRLRTLINQSLNWQHHLCKNPRPNPDMRTLFVDHSCGPPFDHPLMGAIPRVGGFPAGAHGPFQHAPTPLTTPLAGWTRIPSSMPHQAVSAGPIGPIGIAASSEAVSVRKRSRTPSTKNPTTGYQTADSEHVLKRSRPGMPDEVNNLPDAYPGQSFAQSAYSSDDLPKNVVVNLNQGSVVKSMDFHPVQQTLLLVGTNIGDITIWEVGSRERLVFQNFKVWDLSVCSVSLQASLTSEYNTSVNRVTWNSDGTFFGVAYSRNIVHIYSYLGGSDLRNHLEIEAHSGNVSDLAFSQLPEQLCVVTCGEDRTVKVWDAMTGNMQYTFEGHAAPVYSVCPHHKEHVQFIFSTSVDGKIKTWLYDNAGSRVDYDTPGLSCTTMAYSSDGTRLFSCGTNREGESFLVEWNEIEGAIKRMYLGLGKESVNVVQFDTTRNRFLAAGDEFRIKFWDMENVNMMTFTDADGGLMASPCLRFNKEGMLLAVSTNENGIKILANVAGARILRSIESRALDASRATSGAIANGPIIGAIGASSSTTGNSSGVGDRSGPMSGVVGLNGNCRIQPNVKPSIVDDNSKIWKLNEITEPSQIRSLRLPDSMLPVKVSRLMYTNSGAAILALPYNAVHKLWKWPKKEQNPSGKATSNIPPKLWQPLSGIQMANDIGDNNVEDAVPCLALSNNDAYVMSASGGKISLFNMMSFKTMATFLTPPPAATFIAFHPEDNNIIAIGMDDSSIQIYNVRFDKVQSKLKGHLKRVTGLVFSNVLNVLVSSGADAQLCVWSMDAWEKQESESLQIPAGRTPNPLAPTHIRFHKNQIHLLVAHETQMAIYVAPELECVKQWVPQESSAITDATYSCDSQSIYACFEDGTVAVLTGTTLQVKCRVYPNAYIPSNPSNKVYPVVIASHPTEPNQFAVGLSDGAVRVLEPSESEGKWGDSPPVENGGPSVSSPTASDQQPR